MNMLVVELITRRNWLKLKSKMTIEYTIGLTIIICKPITNNTLRCQWLCPYLIMTYDHAGNGLFSSRIHSIAFWMVNSSWMFKRRRGRWHTRNTRIKPINMTAMLSSFFRLDSFTDIAAGGGLLVACWFWPPVPTPSFAVKLGCDDDEKHFMQPMFDTLSFTFLMNPFGSSEFSSVLICSTSPFSLLLIFTISSSVECCFVTYIMK